MSLSAGDKLGPYEIVGRLGAGGMGEVYRARDPRLQREVAIKILPAALAQDAEALRRLEREARAIAALNHPNLLAIYDLGALPNGSPFLVAELLEGATLRQRLTSGPLPQRKALDYAHQIARGLAAAHAKGIVHRDLKPDNLFCCDDGRVKILDFGLAKAVETAGAEERTTAAPIPGAGVPVDTAAGVVLGTMGYMAPEQARGLPADARADIFSLGAVLYEMLAGQRAFRGETTADVISAILREEPPELTQSGRAVAPALERIVRHSLEKEPSQRFQSASDLAFDLQELSQASGSSLAAGAASVHAPPRRRLLFATIGTVGLALAVALAWLAARATFAPPAPHLVRLTYQRGSIASARFLPGGQDFIGAADWNGSPVPTLFTGRLGSPGLEALADRADAVEAVSPAGGVALLRDAHLDPAGGGGVVATLCSMPLGGGAPRPLLDEVEAADWPQGDDLSQSALLARFHPDRHQTTLEYPPGKVLYTTPDFISDPRLSRHGRRIAFLEHPIPGDDQGFVVVIDRDGSGKKILTRDLSSTAGLAWSPRGDEVWFAANVGTSARGLQAVNLAGKLRTLMEGLDELQLADVASDGRVLLIANDERFTTELVTPQQPTPRDVSILDLSDAPFLSADGRQLLLEEERDSNNYSTYLRDTAGGPPVRLGGGAPQALSPDGKWALSLLPAAPRQLMLLPTGAGAARQLTHASLSFRSAAWLPNSQAVVAVGAAAGQPPRSYRVDLTGAITPLTSSGETGTLITPDGNDLLVQSAAGAFQLLPLPGGAAKPVLGLQPGDRPLRFANRPTTVLVARRVPARLGAEQIWRVDLASGRRELAATLAPPDEAGVTFNMGASVSQDGKTYALAYATNLSTLFLVQNLR